MTTVGMERSHAQSVGIDNAILSVAEELSTGIRSGASVAVVFMGSGSNRMSHHLIDELIAALAHIGEFTVMSRAQLDRVMPEPHVQMSEITIEVANDVMAQSIGDYLGVQYVVTGSFGILRDSYIFRVRLVAVETAVLRVYTAYVQGDTYVRGNTFVASVAAGTRRPVQTAEVRAPGTAANQDTVHWISGEIALGGVSVRYERDINNWFSMGGSAWLDFDLLDLSNSHIALGGTAIFRLFPGIPGIAQLFLELGLGGGLVLSGGIGGGQVHGGVDFGAAVIPSIGLRLGGEGGGFFTSPFVSFPIVIGISTGFNFNLIPKTGVGLGRAW